MSPAHVWVLARLAGALKCFLQPSIFCICNADSQHGQTDIMLRALAAHCQRLVPRSTAGTQACAAKGTGSSAQLSMDEEQLLLLAQRCFWELSWPQQH